MTDKDILLVEDNPDDVELTRIAFDEAKVANNLVVVRDGAEALDYLFARGTHADRDPADLPSIVLLDLNGWRCAWRVIKRRIVYRNATRADRGAGCPEELDPSHVWQVLRYRRRELPRVLDHLANARASTMIFTLRNPSEVSAFVNHLAASR